MKRVYVNEPACIGCRLCEVHCQFAHATAKDMIKAFKKATPPLPRLRVEVQKPISFSVRCQHCDEPACVYACLTGALAKDPQTGVVTVDTEKCMGCWTCILVCPYAAINRDGDKISKCDLCTGKPLPSCVANCPNEALVYAETKAS